MAIAVVGMLDEREEALRIIQERIEQRGHRTCLIDISVGTGAIVPTLEADVTCRELAELAEKPRSTGLSVGQGNAPTSVMAEGLKAKIRDLHGCGELQGMIAITGMTGALISLPAMMELPFGVPKLLISGATGQPVHAAKFGDYFALRDITVMHTVVDTVGMNPLVRALALNGADAISGMVEGGPISLEGERPSIAVTEFGYCDKGRLPPTSDPGKRLRDRLDPRDGCGRQSRPGSCAPGRLQGVRRPCPRVFQRASARWESGRRTGSSGCGCDSIHPVYLLPRRLRHDQLRSLREKRQERLSVDVEETGGEKAARAAAKSPSKNECRGDGADRPGCRGQTESVPAQGQGQGGRPARGASRR